jgi:saccharopine dehydrogenase (NADP+, L-glutamate forming)
MEGRIESKGVNIPVIPEVYEPVLDELEQFGVVFKDEVRDL